MQLRTIKAKGFSLIELVIVIMLIGILAVSLTNITQFTISGYIDAKDRNQLSQSAKFVTEKIAREVREALPQSIRVNVVANTHCLEFMNIANASTSLDIPASGDVSSFNAVGFDINFTANMFVAIMPIDANSIYSIVGTLGSVASITNAGNQALITLAGPTNFARRSPQNRFYLLNTPISYCLNTADGQLTRYDSYPITVAQQTPPFAGNSELVAENYLANGAVFNYQLGTLSRSSLLQINFQLQNRDRNLTATEETFQVFHEVHVRNVP